MLHAVWYLTTQAVPGLPSLINHDHGSTSDSGGSPALCVPVCVFVCVCLCVCVCVCVYVCALSRIHSINKLQLQVDYNRSLGARAEGGYLNRIMHIIRNE